METIDRYVWEDALIKAESLGLLPPGAVNLALRLASAITWKPKGNKPSGLYWKNEDALASVGASRATYFRYRQSLFETGFLTDEDNNLIPQVPDLSQIETDRESQESQIETNESHIETEQSQIETTESQIDTPYTVDTFTVDESTVDSFTEEAPVVADAPTVPSNKESSLIRDIEPAPNREDAGPSKDAVGDTRQSQIETEPVRDGAYFMALRQQRPLTKEEKAEWAAYGAQWRARKEERELAMAGRSGWDTEDW